MKETVLDVLLYLFETCSETDEQPEPDRGALREELETAGFPSPEIDKALAWLDALSEAQGAHAADTPAPRSTRVFNSIERERLGAEGRGYIMYLEQSDILSSGQREVVLDRLLALEDTDIDIDQIKWVVLMVLFSHPEQDATAYARMEDLVFEDSLAGLH